MWRFWERSGAQRERDLDDELQSFVDELTARNVAQGMSPEEARRAALIETGGVQQVREATREVWTMAPLDVLARDVRHGGRMIARAPGFALVVISTIGLSIAASVTMFSVMLGVLWRALPYPDADRLLMLDADYRGRANAGVAGGELDDVASRAELVDRVATLVGVDAYVDVDGQMDRVTAASVSDEMWPMLGAQAHLGRVLDSSRDLTADRASAIVVSDEFRRRWFSGTADIIGRHIRVNNLDVQIVGVLPAGLRVFLPPNTNAAEQIDVWFPTRFEPGRRARDYHAIVRVKPGVTLIEAQAELDALAAAFVQEYPEAYPDGRLRLHVTPLHEMVTHEVRGSLWALGGAVAFVLLIGCVNVANLMLARARNRERELAVRRALGASRLRIVRQLFLEHSTLVLLGGILGLLVAYAGVELIEWLRPTHLPRQSQIALNGTVVLFSVGLTVVVAVIVGLLPGLGEARAASAPLLITGRAGMMSPRRRRLQRGLVIAEVALSIVPLVGAGLMLRSFVNLTQAPIGFEPEGRLTARLSYSFRAFPRVEQRWALHREALERVRRLPGVDDVSAATPLPFARLQLTRGYSRADDAAGLQARATFQSVLPGYLRVAGVALLAGRDFTADDIVHQRLAVIVDERIATRLWPSAAAVGQRLAIETGRATTPAEVIGVTRAVRVTQVRDDATPHVFVPYHFFPAEMSLVIRTAQPTSALIPGIRQAVESLGTQRPVNEFVWMQDYVDRSIGDSRFTMLILTGFGAASILLAAVGLYGTLAYLTSVRTQEFGVRMALGASAGKVLRTVAGEGLTLAAVGAALGFSGAVVATRVLQGMLYNVTPLDGVTLVAVVGLVAVAALAATLHPAWRASRANPMHVLRAAE
jgi:putative ABC transport system permease protein